MHEEYVYNSSSKFISYSPLHTYTMPLYLAYCPDKANNFSGRMESREAHVTASAAGKKAGTTRTSTPSPLRESTPDHADTSVRTRLCG